MSNAPVTAGIEIPGSQYRTGVASTESQSKGPSTPPNTPLSSSLNPNLISKSWFTEQFHRQMMIHTQSGLRETSEPVESAADEDDEDGKGENAF